PEIRSRFSKTSRRRQLEQAAMQLVKLDAVPVLEVLRAIPDAERQPLEPSYKAKVQKVVEAYFDQPRAELMGAAPNFSKVTETLNSAEGAAKFLSQPLPRERRDVLERLAQLKNRAEAARHGEALVWVENHSGAVTAELLPAFRQALAQVAGETGQKSAVVKVLTVLQQIPDLGRSEATALKELAATLTQPVVVEVKPAERVGRILKLFAGKPTEADLQRLAAEIPDADRRGTGEVALAYRSLDAYVRMQGADK